MTMTMTTPNVCETLCIQILEDVEESGLFVVRVTCTDLFLLGYWWNTEPFQNELLEQTGTVRSTGPDHSLGLEFVLRVRHRAPGLENAHYWSPFILRLCLDALRFRFLLPPQAQTMGIQEAMQETGELVLQRWTMQNRI